MSEQPRHRLSASPAALWLSVAALCALALSLIDTVLLQLSRNFVTGGFLASASLDSAGAVAGFLAASLLLDFSWLIAFSLCLRGVLRIRPWLSPLQELSAAALLGLAIPLLFDVARYELQRYLGDLADLRTLLAVAGGWPREMLAQASHHLLPLAGFLLAALLATVLTLRWLRIREPQGPGSLRAEVPRPRTLLIALMLAAPSALLALAGSCAAGSDLCVGLRAKPTGSAALVLLDRISDLDFDGYGLFAAPPDPAPFDSRIHPYAIDLPGNAIDENGLAGDHPAEFSLRAETLSAEPWQRKPQVLFVLLESFRADLLEKEVNGREITPFMNRLAAEGAKAEGAFVVTPFTSRSRPQLFTGSIAARAGAETLLDDFHRNGYFVAYFSAQDESFGGSAALLGTEDKADVFYDARRDRERRTSRFSTPGSLSVSARLLNERVVEFLAEHDFDRPTFLYLNYHDTHFPYHHDEIENLLGVAPLPRHRIRPEAKRELFETYANTAANVDLAIEEVVGAWRAKIGDADHAILITADHGEALFDAGYLGHGQELSDLHTRVPLLVWGLSGEWPDPLLLTELRRLLGQSLQKPSGDAPLRFVEKPGRELFQFVPDLDRPRFIGLRGDDFTAFYDTARRDLVVQRRSTTAPSDAQIFERLIHRFEAEQRTKATQRTAR